MKCVTFCVACLTGTIYGGTVTIHKIKCVFMVHAFDSHFLHVINHKYCKI